MADEGTAHPSGGHEEETELTRLLVSRAAAACGGGMRSIKALPSEHAELVARRAVAESRGAPEIMKGLAERGLVRSFDRAKAFTAFSHTLANTKTVAIVPFSSPDKKSPLVGGLGMSDGQPANGVVVELDGTSVVRFTTLDFLEGEYSEKTFEVADLVAQGPEAHVEERERGAVEPHLTVDASAHIATHAFRVLVTDDHSRAVHTAGQVGEFMHQLPIVSMIAELQYSRLRGLAASPDVSCCSCCCCCWGCCSSCSAVSSAYVNPFYYAKAG
jgi:hypothetical protein